MAARRSAGLLPYRRRGGHIEVFLVHPGGPFWSNKDDGAWSIAKGEIGDAEDPLACAKREFAEETSLPIEGDFVALEPVRQPSGKEVRAWAIEAELDASAVRSNTCTVEWPPRSGQTLEIPEVDRAAWFSVDVARVKLLKGQRALVDQLERLLSE